ASDTELKVLKGLKPVKGGPYQVNVDKLTRWMTQNPEADAAMLLGKPEWYLQANAASRSAYNRAIAAGRGETLARRYSYEMYEAYIKQAKGKILNVGGGMPIGNRGGGATVALVLSTALLSFIPKPTLTDSKESK